VSLEAAGGEEIVRTIVLHPQPPREEAGIPQEVTPARVWHVVPMPPCC
jgi:hypothetical protein